MGVGFDDIMLLTAFHPSCAYHVYRVIDVFHSVVALGGYVYGFLACNSVVIIFFER
jgi:hypothetical protein